jgi:hypothetical protein
MRAWAVVAAAALAVWATPAHAGGCDEDVNGDGTVNFADVLGIIAAWGPCLGCPADVNGDSQVNFADILDVIARWGTDCTDPLATQLAGNPLAAYPHFEYVAAFNEETTVSFAIDPLRFPELSGQTCDLYIVAARTLEQWDTDATLVDVRGASQEVTIGAGSIQNATIALTGSTGLSGAAGTGLGIGYDLVCDVNRNGTLDGADVIDGFSDEAGFYVVHDLTLSGPLAVTEVNYSVDGGTVTPGFEAQNLFYPSNIGFMGQLPLIVVSHGNGHNYEWYDHIGVHMASYGYVVMSHQNNTQPGVVSAAQTTLEHTDAFLGQLDTIEGGLLQNHVDTARITWIGHSRGGEGVVIAYNWIVDGSWVPINYDLDDIVLISSIAPVDFQGPGITEPNGVSYSLWTGGSDSDVNGCASCDLCQTFHLHDRATSWRQSISLHGVGHGDFHAGNASPFATGPCLVGRVDTHKIVKGYLLPLVKHYVEGNIPGRDFLWRQWESFHPIGAPVNGCVTVDLMFREDPGENVVIDDYQTQPAPGTSSSGGNVVFTVSNLTEGELDDANSDFTNVGTDVMNGMTVGSNGDSTRGVVFQWDSDAEYEQAIVPAHRDFTNYTYLTFRAAQSSRHPNTTAELGDLTFTVELVDGSGGSSAINIGAYGGGIEEPYQRTGCGTGSGWANEFETIRMRLSDFLNNGTGLDLTDVTAIRFLFGPSYGSDLGRIGLDEITLSYDPETPQVGAITIDLPDGAPDLIPPGVPTDISVEISGSSEALIPGTALLHYSLADGFQTVPLTPAGADLFTATLPAPLCSESPEYYFSAVGTLSGQIFLPTQAPSEVFSAIVGTTNVNFADDFESNLGWTTEILGGATSGQWERGVPVNDPGWQYDPQSDSDGSGQCYLTQNAVDNTDVDNGAVRLTSPSLDLTGEGLRIQYDYYLNITNADGTDRLLVEINTADGVGPWTEIAVHSTNGGLSWRTQVITAADLAGLGVTPTAASRVRFTANDGDPQSIVEAGLDAFEVLTTQCNE